MITNQKTIDAIRSHGEATYPEECCGFLLGASAETNTVKGIYKIANARGDNRERRFLMTPLDYLKAEKFAREAGLDIVGTYHSHPDHPAQPSATDLEEATFPRFSYIIVSVVAGKADVETAWLLAEDRSRFISDQIEIQKQVLETA